MSDITKEEQQQIDMKLTAFDTVGQKVFGTERSPTEINTIIEFLVIDKHDVSEAEYAKARGEAESLLAKASSDVENEERAIAGFLMSTVVLADTQEEGTESFEANETTQGMYQ